MSRADPLDMFRTEAAELLEQIEQGLLDLEHRLDDRSLIDAVFRGLHTLKGSGAMFGFDALAAFTHHCETAFDAVRKGHAPASVELVAAVLAARDHMRALVEDPDGDHAGVGAMLLDRLREAIEMMGHHARIASDGPEGLRAAHEFGPDVVLCDIGLPGMDGYEVARRLRQDPSLSSAMLVAVTGYALPEDCRRAMEAGFNQHLPKPPDLDSLERLLDGAARTPARASCAENREP